MTRLVAFEDILVAIRSLKAAYTQAPEIKDEYERALWLLQDALQKVDVESDGDSKWIDEERTWYKEHQL